MNLRRTTALACLPLTAVLFWAGCGGGPGACNDCPDVSGSWTLTFDGGQVPPACTDTQTLPKEPLVVAQVGSGLTATQGALEWEGTLFDSWDYTLRANEPDESGALTTFTLSGRFVQGQQSLQTEDRLLGTYTASYPGSGACILSRGYTATRTP